MGSGGLFDFGTTAPLTALSEAGQSLTVPTGSVLSEMAPTLTNMVEQTPVTWVNNKPVMATGTSDLLKLAKGLGGIPGLAGQQQAAQGYRPLQGMAPPAMPQPHFGGGGGVSAPIPFPAMQPQQIQSALSALLQRLNQLKTGI